MIGNYSEDNLIVITDFLRARGLNEYAVFGMVANIYAESRLQSNNLQNSYTNKLGLSDEEYTEAVDNGSYTAFATDRAGYGLCQWTSSGRKQNMFNYCKLYSSSIGDLYMQLCFLWHELTNSYKSVLKALQKAASVDEAARVVMLKFERPANQSEANQLVRVGYGQEFYDKYAIKEVQTVGKVKIAINAGHYINTAGKRCLKKLDANETREWSLNDRIADRLESLLKSYDCEVLRIDDTTGLIDTSLSNRCKKANEWGADAYISIHHNAGVNGGSGGGTVVFYYSSKAERKTQAQDLYNAVVGATGLTGNRANKVVKKNYYELSHTNMAAFLLENGFMDSSTDVPIILSEEHATKTAQGLLKFLVNEYKLKKVVSEPETKTTYKVQCGAFSVKANAEALRDKLKADGYEAVVVSGSK